MKAEIGHISTMGRLRKADPKQVAGIAESIKEVGLLNPITVVPGKVIFNGQKIDGYQLVAGLHRLEACKGLGWADIPIVVLDLDEQQRIIAECDENLCGSVLTATERAMFSAKRKEAYEALHPEARAGFAQASGMNAAQGRGGQVGRDVPSFADDQAAKTGQSARAIRRDAERGQQVCKEALDILKGTKADTGVVLDAIKDLDPAAQVVAAYREVQKRQEPKIQAKAPPIAPDADSEEIALERQVDALMKAWNRASPDARREFLGRIDSPLMDKGGWE